ncbi:heterogeneous nuclear ribonucleoprotein A/B-like [Brevipalpus obovatus]|uniref:heterogeneous nuclear ribonucleoprotein A/B-like n=1 Tax=Brevipalpus obovatus TaxID=246614 RepID=UPI003D9EEDB6
MAFSLYIKNIAWTVGKTQLREYFSRFGTVLDCKVAFDPSTGLSKKAGHVRFADRRSFEHVHRLGNSNQLFLEGNEMRAFMQNNNNNRNET